MMGIMAGQNDICRTLPVFAPKQRFEPGHNNQRQAQNTAVDTELNKPVRPCPTIRQQRLMKIKQQIDSLTKPLASTAMTAPMNRELTIVRPIDPTKFELPVIVRIYHFKLLVLSKLILSKIQKE